MWEGGKGERERKREDLWGRDLNFLAVRGVNKPVSRPARSVFAAVALRGCARLGGAERGGGCCAEALDGGTGGLVW